jgi:hypothetical protein
MTSVVVHAATSQGYVLGGEGIEGVPAIEVCCDVAQINETL